MAISEFNLLDEPWILASDQNGKSVKLSLTAVFERAHELTSLSGELPTQDAVILRLLLAVLHGAFPYEDENGDAIDDGGELDFWRRIWSRGSFPMEAIERYLERYRERFWLFHPERPFFQTAGLDKGTAYSASKLIGELSESENKLRLFQSRSGASKSALEYDEAARWLPYLIGFDDTSSKPTRGGDKKLPSPGAGWVGKLGMIYAVGANLFETLLLNFILFNDNEGRWEPGGAVWELERPRTAERVEIPFPESQGALLTLQSRRVLLERKNGAVTGFRLLGGDFFSRENAYVAEQMSVWRSSKEHPGVYTPRRHDSKKLLWRDFSSLLGGADGAHIPGIVSWLAMLEEARMIERRQVRLRASAVQYGDKDFYVTDLFDDMLSVNAALLSKLGEEWTIRITGEIETTEKLVRHLGRFASDLALAAGDSKDGKANAGRRSAAEEEAYFRLDAPFRLWLAAIVPGESELDDACQAWRETACRIVRRLGRELVGEAGDAALIGRMVEKAKKKELLTAPMAYNRFVGRVRKTQEG